MNQPDFEINKVTIDTIESDLTKEKNISLSILRLDKIHPVISGNKLFKLHYFLDDAINADHKQIITFGGAYSNHLAACAFAGRQYNLQTIGIVRGERPKELSHTLRFCIEQGMQLVFISRKEYSEKEEAFYLQNLTQRFGDHILIPEGGYNETGMKGAEMISQYYTAGDYSHICCAIGTATTFAGLVNSSKNFGQVIGFPVLKNMHDLEKRMKYLSVSNENSNYTFINDYYFGGYAKKDSLLISFINEFFSRHHVPLDFVYTGKLMFGVTDLIKKDYFSKGDKILCIHTGGLQGNLSLPKGMLNF